MGVTVSVIRTTTRGDRKAVVADVTFASVNHDTAITTATKNSLGLSVIDQVEGNVIQDDANDFAYLVYYEPVAGVWKFFGDTVGADGIGNDDTSAGPYVGRMTFIGY